MSFKPTPKNSDGSDSPAGPADAALPPSSAATEFDEPIDVEPVVRKAARRGRSVAPSRFSMILVAILAGSAVFVGGFSLGAHVATTPGTPAGEESRFGPFWDVYSLIQNDWAGSPKPSKDQLVQAAIKGMMESLNDPWSYYQGPTDFQNSLLNVGGQGEGIGVQIQLQPIDPKSTQSCSAIGNGCELAVVKPIPGSPAEAAGILPGDVIVSVDGTSLNGKTVDEAIALVKGPADTTVKLGLTRGTQPISLSIVRKVYSQPEVATKTLANGAVAYISISGINPPASSQFHLALANALAAGQHQIVLDLRGNLGGYVADAVKIASEFIPSGTICWQVDANGKKSELTATSGGLATDPSIHLVVLVDGNTASAAEILSAALQDRGRAKLVGFQTYGKGVAQEYLPLSNNYGGIHLTVAKWLTPNGRWIQDAPKGLTPNVTDPDPKGPNPWSNPRAGTDPVLDAGLGQLGFAAESGASAGPGASVTPGATPSPSSGAGASPAPSASSTTGGGPGGGEAIPVILLGLAGGAAFLTLRRYRLVPREPRSSTHSTQASTA
jgi:carboxyl-terminal processing protease